MRRGPEMVVIVMVIMAFMLTGCKSGGMTAEEVTLEEGSSGEESGGKGESKEDLSGGENGSREPGEEVQRDYASDGENQGTIWVHICGQVASPGVYELSADARVYEAVECAGGILENGAQESLNLARKVSDGERIYVPTKEEAASLPPESGENTGSSGGTGSVDDGKVNINTADKEELMTLTGIGETRAEAILAYREENGSFRSPEDIMNVQGIKEGIYEKIKEQIKTI